MTHRLTGIRPDKPKTLGKALQEAILGSDGVDRLKALTARMDALGLTAEEKVSLTAQAMQEAAGLFDTSAQLVELDRLISELEAQR